MARKIKITTQSVIKYRRSLDMNQTEFWARYGVTQSGGSRYEAGRAIPKPVRMLLAIDMGLVIWTTLPNGVLSSLV